MSVKGPVCELTISVLLSSTQVLPMPFAGSITRDGVRPLILPLWIALVPIGHELSLLACLPLLPPTRCGLGGRKKNEGEK